MLSKGTRDRIGRWVSELSFQEGRLIAGAVVVVGVVAGALATIFSPGVETRHDAEALGPVFVGLLAATLTVVAVYAVLAKREVRSFAVIVAAIGCLASIVGLLQVGLGVYPYAFGVAVGALVGELVVLVVTLARRQG